MTPTQTTSTSPVLSLLLVAALAPVRLQLHLRLRLRVHLQAVHQPVRQHLSLPSQAPLLPALALPLPLTQP